MNPKYPRGLKNKNAVQSFLSGASLKFLRYGGKPCPPSQALIFSSHLCAITSGWEYFTRLSSVQRSNGQFLLRLLPCRWISFSRQALQHHLHVVITPI